MDDCESSGIGLPSESRHCTHNAMIPSAADFRSRIEGPSITRVMAAEGSRHVWLDARGLGEQVLLRRFPSIVARCREFGVDPVTEPIPVAPAAQK